MAPVSTVDLQAALYLLKDFLEEQRRLSSQGITLSAIYGSIESVSQKLDELQTQQVATNMRLDRYGKRLKILEKAVLSEEQRDPEDSGVFHQVEAIRAEEIIALRLRVEAQQKELEQDKRQKADDSVWWKRQRWIWVIAGLMAIFTVLLTSALSIFVAKTLSRSEQHSP